MKCKVRMTHTIEFFVEGKSEDSILDWMNGVTPEQARELIDDVDYEDYAEEIICPITDDSIVDYVINE